MKNKKTAFIGGKKKMSKSLKDYMSKGPMDRWQEAHSTPKKTKSKDCEHKGIKAWAILNQFGNPYMDSDNRLTIFNEEEDARLYNDGMNENIVQVSITSFHEVDSPTPPKKVEKGIEELKELGLTWGAPVKIDAVIIKLN